MSQLPVDNEPSSQAIVAVDADNGMDVCMMPETLTGSQRSLLKAELEYVREIKRQRDLDGQPRRIILRSKAKRHSPKRLNDYHVYVFG